MMEPPDPDAHAGHRTFTRPLLDPVNDRFAQTEFVHRYIARILR